MSGNVRRVASRSQSTCGAAYQKHNASVHAYVQLSQYSRVFFKKFLHTFSHEENVWKHLLLSMMWPFSGMKDAVKTQRVSI